MPFKAQNFNSQKILLCRLRSKSGRLILSKAPFNHSKTMLLRLKIHVFCLVIHPDKQTNVNHSAFSRHTINIRYPLIFQIEKIFCHKFLLKARTADKRKSKEFAAWNEKKQQDNCSVGYAIRQHKISGSLIRNSYLNSYFFD